MLSNPYSDLDLITTEQIARYQSNTVELPQIGTYQEPNPYSDLCFRSDSYFEPKQWQSLNWVFGQDSLFMEPDVFFDLVFDNTVYYGCQIVEPIQTTYDSLNIIVESEFTFVRRPNAELLLYA